MSLMELIVKVLKIKKRDFIALFINSSLLILFYLLLFENSEIVYPVLLSSSVILVYFIFETINYRNFLEKLEDSKKSPNYRNNKVNANEMEILSVIKEIHNDYLNRIYSLDQSIKDRYTLFSKWIHNMKTSITVIDLACEKSALNGENNKCMEDIKEENATLKKNLEECLNILRLDDFSRDYMTDSCNLRMIINEIVNAKKRDFIYKGVFPKVDIDESIYVYTDKKWFSYMIEQIISNAIKYSNGHSGSSVNIKTNKVKNKIELIIEDEGIGISKEDLPRVFDPFFTGNNGRKERSATGIGLYMVKIIANKLGHVVEIDSELGDKTQVKIILNN
ncbi:hypothetical protein SAMN02745163_01120 [Clostridium cavendishii DSM 21758]|uniref:histidine kinase n=1 Tax=Clostridium cavendishii DSM 21758 TaxID=1121302 RepID=A0A1M6FEX0_9CLOT|nr:sensor histidine kinase [Clostridium cavendishii]SHI96280.1 hypothetical protein SAMN02745163_01120 [Clostridium cavendishii DSM 21758]